MRWPSVALCGVVSILGLAVGGAPAWPQGGCTHDPRRVVGGEPTDIKYHPWQVVLHIDEAELCGGSIIAPNWVLTAAHCFTRTAQPGRIRVKAGVTNYKTGGNWAPVDRVVLHDKYNADNDFEHDLALVKLKKRPAGEVIRMAETAAQLKPCEELEVTGWGYTKERGKPSNILQKASVPYVDNATCNEPSSYGGKIRPGMMCAGFIEGQVDACSGDSGGPLVLKRDPAKPMLVGVVSWGTGCARELKYGVYTRVTAYHDWIAKVIVSHDK